VRASKSNTTLNSGYIDTIGLSSMKTVTDRHRYAAYRDMQSTGDEVFSGVKIDNRA